MATKDSDFFKIALAIGEKESLHEMLQHSLAAYLTELHCRQGVILEHQPDAAEPFVQSAHPAEAAAILDDPAVPAALNEMLESGGAHQLFELDDNRRLHLFQLPSFGWLLLETTSSPLDAETLQHLKPLNEKLGRSAKLFRERQRLSVREKRFRSFFELSPEAIVLLDAHGILLDANPRMQEWLGYAPEDILGRRADELEFLPRESQEKIRQNLTRRRQGEAVPPYELEFIARNGEMRTGLVQANLLKTDEQAAPQTLAMITDITQDKHTRQMLDYQNQLQNILARISSKYINTPLERVDQAINQALQELGEWVGADRSYIFDYDFEKRITTNTYEWCATGIAPQINELQQVPIDMVPEWVAAHKQRQPMLIPDVDALPPGGLKDILAPQDIKSLLAIPMFHGDELIGFVGFDSVRKKHNYTDKELQLLSLFSQILVNFRIRSRSERALAESEERYRAVAESAVAGITLVDAAETILFANQAFADMLGLEPSALIGKNLNDFMETSVNERLKESAENNSDERFASYEAILRKKSGEPVYILISASKLNNNQKAWETLAVAVDISERKRSERQLELERDLGLALSKAASLEKTLHLCLLGALRAADLAGGAIYLGEDNGDFTLRESVGLQDDSITIKPELSATSNVAELVHAGEPVYFEPGVPNPLHFKNHGVALLPIRFRSKTLGFVLMIAGQSLSEQSRRLLNAVASRVAPALLQALQEEDIRRSRRDLENLFNTMEDFLFIINEDLNIVTCNSVAAKRLGYSREELIGTSFIDIHPKTLMEQVDRIIAEIRSGKRTICDVPLQTRAGVEIPVETRFSHGKWGGQDVMFGISRDMTAQQQAQAAIYENMRIKNDFIANVSHELRTPLSSILGFTSTILQSPEMDDDTRNEFLSIIHTESHRLSDLIEDVLSISRIDSGKTGYKQDPIHLDLIANAVFDSLKLQAENKNIDFSINIETDLPTIMADANAMSQVFTNLVGNALKFTNAGGAVKLELGRTDNLVCFSVTDTGMGIPEKDFDKIFEKFYRVERPGMELQGTGLGLPIVREIINHHGGDIQVESTAGKGSKFMVQLPIYQKEDTT